jgi:preprotein translocase subunit SecG
MLRIALVFLQFFCAAAIIGLVLLQRGKGAEAGAGFGAGASGTVFGARGAGTALSRATAIFTAIFMLNSLALGYVGEHTTSSPKTIFDTAGQLAPHSGAPAQGAPAGSAPTSSPATAPSPSGPAGAPPAQPSRESQPAPAAPQGH